MKQRERGLGKKSVNTLYMYIEFNKYDLLFNFFFFLFIFVESC